MHCLPKPQEPQVIFYRNLWRALDLKDWNRIRWLLNFLCYSFTSFLENSLQIINLKMDLTGFESLNHSGLPCCHRQPDNLHSSWSGELWENLEPVRMLDQALVLWMNGSSTASVSTWLSAWEQPALRALCRMSASEAPIKILTLWRKERTVSRKRALVGSQHIWVTTSFLKIPADTRASHWTFLDLRFSNYYLKGFG